MDNVEELINVLKKAHISALQLDTVMHGHNALLVKDIVGSLSKAITSLEKAPFAKDDRRKNHGAKHNGDKRRNVDAKSCTKVVCENPDDTYVWRKYGQKEIQGLKYPRCYYRCTNKYDLKCQATKQVQQCEDDPSKYKITYIGNHTCTNFYNNQEADDSSFFINFSSNLSPEKSLSFPISYSSSTNLPDSKIIQVHDVPSNGISMHKTMEFPDLMCDVPLMDDHMLSPSIQSSSGSAGTTADFNEAVCRLDESFSIDPFDQFLSNMDVNSNIWNDFSLR